MSPFGLDISDAMIRLVVLDQKGRDWRMPIRAEIPVPEGVVVDGEIRKPEAAVGLMQQLISATGAKLRQAIVALPERHTFIKQFLVPVTAQGTLEEAIHTEASQHLPYAWDEVYHDWKLIGAPDEQNQQRVVLGAAPRTLVDSYLSVLDQANIEAIRMEIESIAVARASYREDEQGAHLLLDLGRTRSTVILVLDGVVLFSATIRYAGKELNRYIADSLHISLSQAERAKTIFGLDGRRGKGVLKKVLTPQVEVVVQKVHEVLDFYQEHFPDHPPLQTISITGSGAMLRGIDQTLAELLGRPVAVRPAWVFDRLHIDDRQASPELPFTYATAFGLALEHLSDHD